MSIMKYNENDSNNNNNNNNENEYGVLNNNVYIIKIIINNV
jgi:hypothetical protein